MAKSLPSTKSLVRSLAKLPLGATLEDVKALLGGGWRGPGPASEGWVRNEENLPVSLRFDNQGRLSFLSIRSGARHCSLHGIAPGMTLDDAMHGCPELRPRRSEQAGSRVDEYEGLKDDDVIVRARFKNGRIVAIDAENSAAIYPRRGEALAGYVDAFPEADDSVAKFFSDSNLKLAIIGDLWNRGIIDLATPEECLYHVTGQVEEVRPGGWGVIEPIRDYLTRYPLTMEMLARLESVSIDFANNIYCYVFPEWEGEGDEFNVRSLEGIEHCASIRELYLTHGCDGVSLRPLTGLQHLTNISSDGACFTDCEALLELPHLAYVGDLGQPLEAHLNQRLREKGVKVEHW